MSLTDKPALFYDDSYANQIEQALAKLGIPEDAELILLSHTVNYPEGSGIISEPVEVEYAELADDEDPMRYEHLVDEMLVPWHQQTYGNDK